MANIFEAEDLRGKKIICTEDCWNNHILRNRPFMNGWEDDVKEAIQDPTLGCIYQDAEREDRCIYYRLNRRNNSYIKVVVNFDSNGLGNVITAFPTSAPKSGEKLIWPD